MSREHAPAAPSPNMSTPPHTESARMRRTQAAEACLSMRLSTSPLDAAAYCLAFVAVNVVAAGLLVRRLRPPLADVGLDLT